MDTETIAGQPISRPVTKAPFLARQPWFGFVMFLLGAIGFTMLTFQVIMHGPLTRWDLPVATDIHNWAIHQGIVMVLLMRFFSSFGRDGLTLIVAILMFLWIRRNFVRELGWLIVGVLGGELMFEISSNLIGRMRPEFKDPFEKLLGPGYPSGHAATSLLLGWLVLALLLPRLRSRGGKTFLVAITVIFVLAICFSRLFLGVHYPTDLLGGLFLGLGWGGLVYTLIDVYFFRRRSNLMPK